MKKKARVADYLFDYVAMFSTLSYLMVRERLWARLFRAYQYGSIFLPGVLMVRNAKDLPLLILDSTDTQEFFDKR